MDEMLASMLPHAVEAGGAFFGALVGVVGIRRRLTALERRADSHDALHQVDTKTPPHTPVPATRVAPASGGSLG